uniref:Uncharacterized protein n=1 Tax=Kalanchoe fedtschenkoi TaxID=63787 RepID=A0A7N0U6R0_KALFE
MFHGQVILINGQFPGPEIYSVTNDNLIVNVHNRLKEPFLLTWNGLQHRTNSYQDGVIGTNCPIPPGQNFTYKLKVKDQIGTAFYFPSTELHKAAGGFGMIKILSRPLIPVPFDPPAAEFNLLIGDWFKTDHNKLKAVADSGRRLPPAQGLLINGRAGGERFEVDPGKTYRLRIVNVGLQDTFNFRIEGHTMKLVEVEGTHTVQESLTSIDVHVGQSLSVLVTADQAPKDYHIAASTRFTRKVLTTTGVLHYNNSGSKAGPSGLIPPAPTDVEFSINQARSIRTNLTASGPRPNPQGSYKYGQIPVKKTIRLCNSAAKVNGKQRYAVNGVSFVAGDTPLKLADYYNISGVFTVASIPDEPKWNLRDAKLDASVMGAYHRDFVEIVFQNREKVIQSWHLDGYSVMVVGMDKGKWSTASKSRYNLADAISRSTVQVYPNSWTAVYVALDNVGMWNLRSQIWGRQYLGQQLYLRVYTSSGSLRDEKAIPKNALKCGRAAGRS